MRKPKMMESTKKLLEAIPFLNRIVDSWKRLFETWGISDEIKPSIADLEKIQARALEMILVAYEIEPGNQKLEEWITKSLNLNSKQCSSWRAGRRNIEFNILLGAETFRLRFVEYITDAFDGVTDKGKSFIGACPRCKKIFEKTRTDQIYDRNTCKREATRGNTKTRILW